MPSGLLYVGAFSGDVQEFCSAWPLSGMQPPSCVQPVAVWNSSYNDCFTGTLSHCRKSSSAACRVVGYNAATNIKHETTASGRAARRGRKAAFSCITTTPFRGEKNLALHHVTIHGPTVPREDSTMCFFVLGSGIPTVTVQTKVKFLALTEWGCQSHTDWVLQLQVPEIICTTEEMNAIGSAASTVPTSTGTRDIYGSGGNQLHQAAAHGNDHEV
eukprot:704974-Rhodomonas_salina.3